MLTEPERKEYEQLMEGRWTMSGYGPGSDEGQRLSELRTQMWEGLDLEELFRGGEIEVPVFNRKDPYENRGYQGHFRINYEHDGWEDGLNYVPGFEIDYIDERIELTAGPDTLVLEEDESVKEVSTAEDLRETVSQHFGLE